MHTTTISLNEGMQERLDALAAQRECSGAEIIQDLLEKYLDHDAYLRAEIQKGIDAADQGNFVSQEEMHAMVRGMGIRVD